MGKIKKTKQKQRETEIHGQCKGKAVITTKNAKNKADNERSRKKRSKKHKKSLVCINQLGNRPNKSRCK